MKRDIDQLLGLLKQDARQSHRVLASKMGLHRNTVARYMRDIEQTGRIKRWTIEVDQEQIESDITSFMQIRVENTTRENLERIERLLSSSPIVIEFYRMKGDLSHMCLIRDHRKSDLRFLIEELGDIDGVRTVTRDCL